MRRWAVASPREARHARYQHDARWPVVVKSMSNFLGWAYQRTQIQADGICRDVL
jgi:hypothetical protein